VRGAWPRLDARAEGVGGQGIDTALLEVVASDRRTSVE